MEKIIATLKARFKEPSSWGGLAILALVALNVIPADVGMQLMAVAGGGIDPGLVLPIAETVAAVPVEESTNWLKIALNVIGVAAGVGGIGSVILGEGGKKAIMAFAVVPLFMLSLGSGEAMAASTVTLRWDIPTERVNGDPLPALEIGGFFVTIDLPSGAAFVFDETNGTATEYLYTPTDPGIYTFRVQAYDKSSPLGISEYSNSTAGVMGLEQGGNAPKAVTITIVVTCDDVVSGDCEFVVSP